MNIPAGIYNFDAIAANVQNLFEEGLAILGSETSGLIIAAVYIAIIVIERVCYVFSECHYWDSREAFANILSSLFVAVTEALLTGSVFFTLFSLIYENMRLVTMPISALTIVIMFFANDLCHYFDHRMQHRISLLWALHIPHHSSTDFNVLVANRGTALQFGLLTSPVYLVLPLLGFPLSVFLFVKFFGNIWGTFSHTKLVGQMGFIEGVFSTPSNHRVHHGIESKYIDKNFGQVLIIWDRVFGTYQPEEATPTYGLIDQMSRRGLWQIQTHGIFWLLQRLSTAQNFGQTVRLLFRPPEWSLLATDTSVLQAPTFLDNQRSDLNLPAESEIATIRNVECIITEELHHVDVKIPGYGHK